MGYIYKYQNIDYDATKYKIYYRAATGWDDVKSVDELTQYTDGTYLTGVHAFGVLCNDGYALQSDTYSQTTVTRYRAGSVTSSTGVPSTWEQGQSSYSLNLGNGLFKFVGFAQRFDGSQSWTIDFKRINTGITQVQSDEFTVTISGTFGNATCNFTDGQKIASGTETTFEITANSGYWFTKSEYLFHMERQAGIEDNIGMTISPDKYKLTWTGIVDGNVTFFSDYTADKYPTTGIGIYTSIFMLSDDNLNALSNITFVAFQDSEYPSIQKTYDGNNKFIADLYKTPFPIPNNLMAQDKNIWLGAVDTTVKSTELTDWTYTIDFGTITITPKYGNVFDYTNIKAELFIPYFGMDDIDVDGIMDNTLTILGYYNLLNGSCTVRVYDKNSVIMYEKTSDIKYTMPFFQPSYEYVSTNINKPPIETVFTPYVVLTRKTPYQNTGFIGKARYFKSKLSDFEDGVYNEVMNINLDTTIPQEIQEEIRGILEGGCFI